MEHLGNTRPSMTFSVGSTDFEDGFTTIATDFTPVIDDPCADINILPNSTTPLSATGPRRPSVAAANASTQQSILANIGSTAGVGSTPPANTSTALPAAASSTANVNPAPALSMPAVASPAPTAPTNPIPVQTEGRRYYVTTGRQVGVFQGAYVAILITDIYP
jgi:hypothetical protein